MLSLYLLTRDRKYFLCLGKVYSGFILQRKILFFQGGLTLDFLFGRLRSLERKFTRSQQELSNTQALIKSLEGRVGQGGGGGGGSSESYLILNCYFEMFCECVIPINRPVIFTF